MNGTIELESLLYAYRVNHPNIDDDVFRNAPNASFWSASRVLISACSDCAYQTIFSGGSVNSTVRNDTGLVRCVRSERNPNAPPEARYVINEAAVTVRDTFTGLEWARAPSAVVDEGQARQFCLNRGNGFRVPTQKELLTLASVTSTVNAVDPAFNNGDALWMLWSTTPAPLGTQVYASSLGLSTGSAGLNAGVSFHVRCVR